MVPIPLPCVPGTCVPPPGSPTELGATWLLGCATALGDLAEGAGPVVLLRDVDSERTELPDEDPESNWAAAGPMPARNRVAQISVFLVIFSLHALN